MPTFIRSVPRLGHIISEQPFSASGADDLVHVGFLKKPVAAGTRAKLEALGNDVDSVTARGKEIYWLARGGMGRATISGTALEAGLGQPMTLRSLKMLRRLHVKL